MKERGASSGWWPVLFGLSGLAGLGLQAAWTRQLALALGHEGVSVFAVVTAVFCGLALGAAAWGWVRRWRVVGLRLCAVVELVAGVWSLVVGSWGGSWIAGLVARMGPEPTPAGWWLGFGGTVLLLWPATLAQGLALPVLERVLRARLPSERRVAGLYAVGTLGACAGVMLSVWVLQPWLGLRGAQWFLGVVHLACAGGFLWLGRRESSPATVEIPENPAAAAGVVGSRLLWLLGATGFIGIGYEVLATRLLGQGLEGTAYSHAAVMVAYLAGTAVGACWYWWGKLGGRTKGLWFLPLLGMLMLGAGQVAARVAGWQPAWKAAIGGGPLGGLWVELGLAFLVMGLPSVAMGLGSAHLLGLAAARGEAFLGRAWTWNLFGAALAPGLVGGLLFPAVGSWWTWLGIGLAPVAGLLAGGRPGRPAWFLMAGVALAAVLLPRPMDGQLRGVSSPVLEVREGMGDTVAVVEQAGGNRALRVNNRYLMGGTASTNAERRHSHVPLLLHPSPRRALFLGVGTGISFAAMEVHPGLRADGVELVREVEQMRGWFAPHNVMGTDLRVRVADARRFVRTVGERYDVVVGDLFHPGRDGAGGLYTREHFEAIRGCLAEGGLYCQWLPLFQLDEGLLRVVCGTFVDVFPESDAFLLRWTADTPVLGLVGRTGESRWGTGWMAGRVVEAELKEALKPVLLAEDLQLLGLWMGGAEWLRSLGAGAARNTDDRPVLVFRAPFLDPMGGRVGAGLLEWLLDRGTGDLAGRFGGGDPGWSSALGAYGRARDAYLRGLIAEARGQRETALARFLESAGLSRDFTTAYAQVLARAAQAARSDPREARRLLVKLAELRPENPMAGELRRRLGL